MTGFAASWLFGFSTIEGLLLGSIVASTDGAAVFSLLRGTGLRRRLERTLEGEAGMNDPIAVLLVLGFIEWVLHPGYGLADMLLLFVQQLGIGLVAGVAVGRLSRWAFQQMQLSSPGPLPGRVARRGGARVRRRRPRCTARASSPSTSPGSRSARPTCPPSGP